jgi:NitT/TauT family transport system ATP-binding protein
MSELTASVEVEHLSASYSPDEIVIQDLSMSIASGEFVCILGPSGCGKSTLLSILSGLKEPTSGRVKIGGVEVQAGTTKTGGPRLGYVFQDPRLLPWRTVSENVSFALKAAGIPREEHGKIIKHYLRLLQIENLEHAWPMAMSGGQRQRASLARALAINPAFVLMDEPFSTLDEVTARVLRQELLRVWEETGKTIIFVTHSIREAVLMADRVFILAAHPGRLYKTLTVDLPRPRRYEDPRLTEIEAGVVSDVLEIWGLGKHEQPVSA